MGCGGRCGGGGSVGTASMQRSADGSVISSTAGLTARDPVILGDPNGTLLRVQVMRSGIHALLRSNQAAWVSGSDVQGLIDDESLMDLAGRTLAQRVWRVGTFNYLDYQQAQDASTATGLPIVEVL